MSIRRITISVPVQTAKRIKQAAGQTPVSSWVTEVIEEHLEDAELERKWREFYAAVNPSAKDRKEAQALHARLTNVRRRKGAA
jgi:predicted DNA-binding protein